MPEERRKIPTIIAKIPPIRADIRAAVLGSAFLNCQPTLMYQEILGKITPMAPKIMKRIGTNVNRIIHFTAPYLYTECSNY